MFSKKHNPLNLKDSSSPTSTSCGAESLKRYHSQERTQIASNPTPSRNISSPLIPNPPKDSWPSTNLTFNEDSNSPLFGNSGDSTVTFPPRTDIIPSEVNGTVANDLKWAVSEPAKTTQSYMSKMSWKLPDAKSTIGSMKDAAADGIINSLNRALEGQDVVEIHNRIVDTLVPKVKVPSYIKLSRSMDKLSDTVQALLDSYPPVEEVVHEEFECTRWLFVYTLGKEARRSLVNEGICREWQVMPSYENLRWQLQLNQKLSDAWPKSRCTTENRLKEMKPKWIPNPVKKTYELVIHTGVVDVEECAGDFIECPIDISTGFELPECSTDTSVRDFTRGAHTVEDAWQMVE
ncbi:hypothetical protein BS50DRAFT_665375 [Corynespora cassiicola Philippines]|uniref:Uncharacterized protein n=1 Tax=Corynespora cassiicola Philippines TaxID=1448308 RepID=A0A2T2NS78_CORCC|nr:hypothetical protein BS50DRAFT_665375 [Corynespora cassiicola Philippines]